MRSSEERREEERSKGAERWKRREKSEGRGCCELLTISSGLRMPNCICLTLASGAEENGTPSFMLLLCSLWLRDGLDKYFFLLFFSSFNLVCLWSGIETKEKKETLRRVLTSFSPSPSERQKRKRMGATGVYLSQTFRDRFRVFFKSRFFLEDSCGC